jgi:hypothetical protein
MSKAIQGAAMLAGAVGMGVAAFFDPVLVASPLFDKVWGSLILGGISMEAGAIANALTSNRGQNITTRQAASYRQIIYGTQRVGGVEIYRSTTGSTRNQFNYVIVIATHECWALQNLYLDGRQVFFNAGSTFGHTVRNGIAFGGDADGFDHIGPNGQNYNFGGKVYCEARYGEQLPGDVIGAVTANDPHWTSTTGGTPYVGGCTYVYLKVEHDDAMFPGEPEIRFTVLGKPLYDPRTSTTAYSSNWALIVNDVLTDATWGLGDASVNQAQLIAAANVCDEQVALAAGGTESRYACHYHYDTSAGPGDVLSTMMNAAAGRLSRIGGEWYIWPAYYQGPTASFDASDLTAAIQWTPTRSYRELFNRVTGTYIAPAYPYNAAGDAYDVNGWYQGTIQNNFPFAFQPTNYPQYAADALHGYASDQYLNEDGGIQLPKEISQQCVLSVAQTQRVARIFLLRNRQQGSGTFQMSLAAYQIQPADTFNMTFSPNGWTDKLLEVNSVTFRLDGGGQNSAPQLILQIGVNETAASVYEWSPTEELTVYDVPSAPSQASYTPAAPTNMTLLSSAGTALVQPDGTVVPRIQVNWDTPLDGFVRQIQMQYQLVGAGAWTDAGLVDVSLNSGFITGVIAGQQYNVRIRSLRSNGAASNWVEVDSFTAGLVLSVSTTDGVGVGSLIGEAFSDGTAAIICEPFTANVGNASVSVTPTPSVDTGLNQGQLYHVYYVDPAFTGGAVTAIATQNPADYRGKVGYFLIDSIVTPTTPTGGSGSVRYMPRTFSDLGSRTTRNAAAAFDGNTGTSASISATSTTTFGTGGFTSTRTTNGSGLYGGFPSAASGSISTLTVIAAAAGDIGTADIAATVNGAVSTLLTATTNITTTTYTLSIPASTPFNTVSVSCDVTSADDGGTGEGTISELLIFEIFIDT